MTHKQPAIQVSGLSKSFEERVVLDRIQLELFPGEIVALMGGNGVGKSTLLRCLAAGVRPDSGTVRWLGLSRGDNPPIGRLIGLVRHESQLYPRLTVRENLVFAARMCDIDQPVRHVNGLLQDIGLQAFAECLPQRLSQGMRQRISLLRGLVHDPPIVLLDEPFSSLDGEGSKWLSRMMIDLRRRERGICFATHDEEKSRRLADRVIHLQASRLKQESLLTTESTCRAA